MASSGSKPVAFVASDCHIRTGLRVFPNSSEPAGDILVSFRQILERIESHAANGAGVPLILAGDVFDTRFCTSSMVAAIRQVLEPLKRILSPLPSLYFVQGQHDATVPTWLEILDPATVHMHDKRINLNGVDFIGVDYCHRLSDLEAYLEKYKDEPPYVLITHFPFSFVEGSYDLLSRYNNIRCIISGDNHVPGKMTLQNGVPFYSVGAMCPNRLNDTNSFSYLFLSLDEKDELQVETNYLLTRAIFARDIISEEDIHDILKSVEAWKTFCPLPELHSPVVVIYTNDVKLISYARYMLSPHCYLFVRTYSQKEKEEVSKADSSALGEGLLELKDMFREYIIRNFGEQYGEVAGYLFDACRSSRDVRVNQLRKAVDGLWKIREEELNNADR